MKPNPVIALVENDLSTNRALARLLQAHGFTVETFVSAELLLARTNPAIVGCLLLDLDLDGMSGFELQEVLQQQGAGLPIIIVSGRNDEDARRRAFGLGCSDFLHKPVNGQVLVAAIGAAMAARPSIH
jgi:two-component system response regulator FixJ